MKTKTIQHRGIDLHRFMRFYNIDCILAESTSWLTINGIYEKLSRKGYTESSRTTYEDINALKTLSGHSGYELKWVERNGTQYFSVDPAHRLFRSNFTEDEIVDLQPVIDLIDNLVGQEQTRNLNRLFSLVEHSSKRQRIVDLGIKAHNDTVLFNRLYDAIKECRVIKLYYHPLNELGKADIEPKFIDFHPYLIKHYNGRWALIGAVASDGYICKFYLEQIAGFETSDNPDRYFKDEERSRVEHIYDHVVGIDAPRELCVFANEPLDMRPPEHIILASKRRHGVSAANFAIHPSQTELTHDCATVMRLRATHPELSDDARIFAIECYLNHDLERALMARAEDFIVLEPNSLRCKIAKQLSSMAEGYFISGSEVSK